MLIPAKRGESHKKLDLSISSICHLQMWKAKCSNRDRIGRDFLRRPCHLHNASGYFSTIEMISSNAHYFCRSDREKRRIVQAEFTKREENQHAEDGLWDRQQDIHRLRETFFAPRYH